MDVQAWARTAPVGEKITYATRGFSDTLPKTKRVMEDAYRAHSKGLVFLYQRRGLLGWHYIAVRISERTATRLGIHPSQRWDG